VHVQAQTNHRFILVEEGLNPKWLKLEHSC